MRKIMIPIAIVLIVAGCQSDSDRVAELASRHATQQSELSRETVKLQNELVEGTQKLVEADAQARRDFLELEGKLDEQRGEVGRRHDELESERREIAKQRYRDPITESRRPTRTLLPAARKRRIRTFKVTRTARARDVCRSNERCVKAGCSTSS